MPIENFLRRTYNFDFSDGLIARVRQGRAVGREQRVLLRTLRQEGRHDEKTLRQKVTSHSRHPVEEV